MKNIILVDPSGGSSRDQLTVLINPQIAWSSEEEVELSEGCLSIPRTFITVRRSAEINVEYQDLSGAKVTSSFDGWAARIAQHEIDHLKGIVMLDRRKKKRRP